MKSLPGNRRFARLGRVRGLRSLVIVGLLVVFVPFHATHAQATTAITSDGTLGTGITQVGNVFEIDGGTIKGSNQFHSFGLFSVGAGDFANFNGPAGTQNVFSRVTGGVGSQIDGGIASSIPGANLFLMNPSGIVFGPESQLFVDGSFHATTADAIGFADGTWFNAQPSAADALLSTAPPSSFGFLDPSPAGIGVSSFNILEVPSGQTLSFVGGPLEVGTADFNAPGFLLAGAGRINLISVASAGEATFDGVNIGVDGFPELGDIAIQGGSLVDAREVFVRGGNFVIDESLILPGVFSFFGLADPPDGGEVNIAVSGDVTITGTGPEAITENPPGILTFAGSTEEISPPADVPDVTITAGGALNLSGFAAVQTLRFGPGEPSNITVKASDVTVDNGAGIAMFNFFEGSGGAMSVDADSVTLSGTGTPEGAVGATGLLAQGLFHFIYGVTSIDPALANGDSGSISITAADSLSVTGAAQITTDSLNFGQSDNITIAAGDLSLADRGGVIAAQSLYAGDGGIVSIAATGDVLVDNGFVISGSTFGTGDSGGINLDIGGALTIQGTASGLATQTAPPSSEQLDSFASLFLGPGATFPELAFELGLDPDTADLIDVIAALNEFGVTDIPDVGYGDGGDIVVTSGSVSVSGQDSAIDSSTAWNGNAGTVTVDTASLIVGGGAQIRSRSGLENLDTGEFFVGTGNAGTVSLKGGDNSVITVEGADSAISTSTFGAGSGGAIDVSAAQVAVINGGQVRAVSQGSGNAGTVNLAGTGKNGVTVSGAGSTVSTSAFDAGDGGSILLTAPQILIQDRGLVTADSTGTGLTGNVTLVASDQIQMDKGSISTSATTSDGGNIELQAPKIIELIQSEVSTSVESGFGGGGNILIDPEFVVLNNSAVIANAFGGPGGNIRIVADNFVPSADSLVQASSQQSVDGTIAIESPENDIAGQIAKLPAAYLAATDLLPEPCAARRSGAASSFLITGRGGLALDPDDYLPSFGAIDGPTELGNFAGFFDHDLTPVPASYVALGYGC